MSIHQEVEIKATPDAVYGVLTDGAAFTKMTGGRKAVISQEAGGAVSLFGGEIEARNVELVPGQRVVQAWRSKGWPEGIYSIVKFELKPAGKATQIIFDQAGFPAGAQEMLEGGWNQMYWQPMRDLLAGS